MQNLGCVPQNKKIVIKQGQTTAFTVQLLDQYNEPFSLEGLTGATGIFPDADGTSGLAATGILASADLATLDFNLDIPFGNDLLQGEDMDFQVWVDQGAVRSIANFEAVLTVKAPPFTVVNFGP